MGFDRYCNLSLANLFHLSRYKNSPVVIYLYEMIEAECTTRLYAKIATVLQQSGEMRLDNAGHMGLKRFVFTTSADILSRYAP